MTNGVGVAEAFVTIRADFSKFSGELNSGITKAVRAAEKDVAGLASLGEKLSVAGTGLTLGLTAPILGIGLAATKASLDFESSFAGIRKTVQLTEEEFDALAGANRALAKDIPVSVNELNRIGQLAGQLGIRGVQNLQEFEKTIAQLAVSTDLSAEEGALAFAQMANVIQLPQDQIDQLGAAVVGLGNNFATVESQIVEFSKRIAGAGALANLTAGDIVGIGTAFASLGVRPEAGGTAIQRVLVSLLEAVTKGGDELEVFAQTAGKSVDEFVRLFEQDAGEAFVQFVEGLGKQGNDAIGTLEELGLTDQRLTRSFLSAANAGDLLRRAVERGNVEFEKGTALQREADKRFATTASQLGILLNRFIDVGITIGDSFNPAIRTTIDIVNFLLPGVSAMAEAFAQLPGPVQLTILGLTGFVATVGPTLFIAGTLVKTIAALRIAYASLAGAQVAAAASTTATAGAFGRANVAALGLARGLGVLGLALGAAFALQAGANFLGIGDASDGMKELEGSLEGVTDKTKALALVREKAAKVSGFEAEVLNKAADQLQKNIDQEIKLKAELTKQVEKDTAALQAQIDAELGLETSRTGKIDTFEDFAEKLGSTDPGRVAEAIAEGLVTIDEETGEFTVHTIDNFQELADSLRKQAGEVKTKAIDILADGLITLDEATGRFTAQQAGAIEAMEAIEREQERFQNRAFELTKVIAGVAYAFTQSEQAARRMTLALAKETTEKAQAAAQALFGKPTRETAQLNQQLAQLQLQQARLPAGTENAALDKQIETIQRQIQVRQAETDIMQNSLTLADRTLLSQGELASKSAEAAKVIGFATAQQREQARLTGQDIIPAMDEMRASFVELQGAARALSDEAFRNALLPVIIGPNGVVTLFDAAAAKAGLLAEAQDNNTQKLYDAAAALERWQAILDSLAPAATTPGEEAAGGLNPLDLSGTGLSEAVQKGVEAAFNGTALDRFRQALTGRLPSNYAGLDYVPVDNYITKLHRGERVLSASDNRRFSQGGGQTTANLNVTVELDGEVLGRYVDRRVIDTAPTAPGRM